AVLPANYTFTTADAGTHTFTGTLKTAGARSVSAADTQLGFGNASPTLTVLPAAASTFRLNAAPSIGTAGTFSSLNVTAYDPFGNVATGYAGTIHFTSTDPQAA